MRTGPPLVPSRQRAVDDLVASVGRPGECSRLVVVTAPAGGGLSTFVRAFADRCGPDADVAAAASYRLLGLPWESRAGTALAPLVDPAADPGATADRLLGHIGTDATTDRGVWDAVIVLDDAHHADGFAVRALISAATRPSAARLLVVLGWCRPTGAFELSGAGAAGAGLADPQLYDAALAVADEVVRLGAPTPDDLVRLAELRGVLLPVSQVDRLLDHGGGRIRNLVEILDEVPAADWAASWFALPAPATAARAIRSAVAALPEAARRLVAAVAILESAEQQVRAVPVADAGRIGGVEATVEAVDAAATAGLLVVLDEHATWVRLPDSVARRSVLDDLGPVRRSELHQQAAGVVTDPAAVLRHRWFARPQPDEELAGALEALADERSRRGEWAAAADLLMLAARASIDVEQGGHRLVRAVDALVGAGEVPRASRHLAELESLRETPLRNAVLGYLAVVRGRPGEAESRLSRAWDLVNPRRDAATASLVAQRHVLHHLARCRPRELVEWADRAIALVPPDAPTAIEAAAIRGLGAAVEGGVDAALADCQALIDRVSDGPVLQRVTMASGWLHQAADDPDRAREELESAVPTDFLGGSVRISLWARAWLARVQFQTGDWTDAMRTATTGVGVARASGMLLLVPLLEWTRTQVQALRGDWSAAEETLRAGDAGARDYEIMRVPAALARAAFNEARADYGAVLRALTPLTQPWARAWVNEPGYWPWADVYANALVQVGRSEEADEFLAPHEQNAADRGHASAQARLAYARGRWHGTRGDLDAARSSFDRALTLLEPLPLRYDRARVQFAYGQTLRRAGRRAEADAVLSSARDAYLALGADTYVARCERELAAGGVNLVRSRREFDDLTPQEEAVAGLVAEGRTNKEVAAELFLSVKTIQYHLTRIYAKLGLRSRAELAARWTQHSGG